MSSAFQAILTSIQMDRRYMFTDDRLYDDPSDPVPRLIPHSDNEELDLPESDPRDLSLPADLLNAKKENSFMSNAMKAFHRQEYVNSLIFQ